MSTTDIYILSGIICISLLVLILLSGLATRIKTKRKGHDYSTEFEIETRTNIRFIFMAFGLILPVLVFLGVNSITSAKETIQSNIEGSLDSSKIIIDSLDASVKKIRAIMAYNDHYINTFVEEASAIDSKLKKSNEQMQIMRNKIDAQRVDLDNIDKVYYLEPIMVTNEQLDSMSFYTYSFAKLKTISGTSLPKFNEAPRIILLNQDVDLNFVHIDTAGFTAMQGGWTDLGAGVSNKHYLQFIIFY